MIANFANDARIVRLSPAIAAGTDGSRTNLGEIDTQGFQCVAFVAQLGTVTGSGVLTLRAKASNTSGTYGSGTVDDIAATPATAATSNTFVVLDVFEPNRRFVRADYQRTVANVAVDAIFAVLYNASDVPVAPVAGTIRTSVANPTPSAT